MDHPFREGKWDVEVVATIRYQRLPMHPAVPRLSRSRPWGDLRAVERWETTRLRFGTVAFAGEPLELLAHIEHPEAPVLGEAHEVRIVITDAGDLLPPDVDGLAFEVPHGEDTRATGVIVATTEDRR